MGEWDGPAAEAVDPSGFGWLIGELRRLQARVSELETRNSLQNASIGEGGVRIYGGGGLTVGDLGRILIESGGSILVKDGQGRDLFYVGGLKETVPGTPQGYAVMLYRLDGSVALTLVDDADDEQVQRLKVFDRNGFKILAEDPQGDGLEWPAIPIPFGGLDYTKWHGTTSTTFAGLQSGFTNRMHRRAYVHVRHTTDVSGTTGQLRLMANGTQVGSTVPVAFAIDQTIIGPFDVPGTGRDGVTYTLEGRVTGGTGKVLAEVDYAWAGGFF